MKFKITARFWVLLAAALLLCGPLGACSSSEETVVGQGGASSGEGGGGGASSSSTSSSGADTDDDEDGFTENDGDCNDGNPNVNPDADEVCDDGIDNNCNGAEDVNEPDGDGDGFGPCQGDCDDDDPLVNPAADEVADGIDNDCDGITDGDYDGDGTTEGDGDCDDADPDVHPGATEHCFDGVDNDCNGYTDDAEPDGDNDGYGPCQGDCDDSDPNVGPDQPEIDGDGIDNNCDNLVDLDVDGDGWTTTNGDCNDTDSAINPAALEDCNDNVDNNCDGNIDTDCLDACQLAELFRSSVGCVYYAIDANNDPIENYDTLPYAVVVSNTDANTAANVDVQVRVGGNWQTQWSAVVAPISLHQFDLPDRHINYTGVNPAGAYRVVSDLPVVTYQFQPVNGASSFTSDASLLLPTSALDRYYYVVGWGEPSYGNAQFNVVATEDGTTVNITPTVNTVAGGGIPALTANVQWTYPTPLDAGDVIQIEANNAFTGTYVTADKPVSVFSTHWCANIPSLGCCCDHLEEQVFGLQTWGQTYVASRLPVRNSGTPEPTLWHVFASENNTQVTYTAHPTVTGLPSSPQTMNQGDFATLSVSGTVTNPGDFLVSADKPIYLMEYLSSSFATNASTAQAGDPAMTQAVPVEQFLDSYVVLVPANWIYDHLVLTKPLGATVNIDGTPVPQAQFTAINDGVNPPQWEVARVTTTDGVHTLDGTAPFGVVVLGYDSYDSYAYPGGLNQELINPIN